MFECKCQSMNRSFLGREPTFEKLRNHFETKHRDQHTTKKLVPIYKFKGMVKRIEEMPYPLP